MHLVASEWCKRSLRRPCDGAGAKALPVTLLPLSSKFVDWGSLQVRTARSAMPEEGTAREEIIEECCWGYINILKSKNKDRAVVLERELSSLLMDEGEERRFLEEDAHDLPVRLFLSSTNKKSQDILSLWEQQSRDIIIESYNRYFCEALMIREEVDRMQIVTEAWDSCFLKLCQVNPFWMWRKLQCIEDLEKEATFKAQQVALYEKERAARKALLGRFISHYLLGLITFARSEKEYIFQCYRVVFFNTCKELLDSSAITIQAAFRGYQVRQRKNAFCSHAY